MRKEICHEDMPQDESEKLHKDFIELSKSVFESSGDVIRIGGFELTKEQRSLLKDQATNFMSSQLWEVISSTLINEASNLALKKSANWDHVNFAKALDYTQSTVEKMLKALTK